MKAFIAVATAVAIILLTVIFNNALFRIADVPFMSNTLMDTYRDPLMEMMNMEFKENPGDIIESEMRWQRAVATNLNISISKNEFDQDIFSGVGVAMALGSNQTAGAVVSSGNSQLLIPGFRDLQYTTDKDGGAGTPYMVWNPQMSIYTNDWIASPFPQTWADVSRPSGVDVKLSDGSSSTSGPIIFTYASPLHLQGTNTDLEQDVRNSLNNVAEDLRLGINDKSDRIKHLSNILKGERPEGSVFTSFNMSDALGASLLHDFKVVFGQPSPLLLGENTIMDELYLVSRLMDKDGFTQQMQQTVLLTLTLTSINDYALALDNENTVLPHWWDNLDVTEYSKGWSLWKSTRNVTQDIKSPGDFIFSPLSMVTLPKAMADPKMVKDSFGTETYVFEPDDLQLYGGAVVQLYNSVKYGSNKPINYLDASDIDSLLFTTDGQLRGNTSEFLSPYRNISGGRKDNLNEQKRERQKDQDKLVDKGKKSIDKISTFDDEQRKALSSGVELTLGKESDWGTVKNASEVEMQSYFLYAYINNYLLAFKTDTDAYSLAYDANILPTHFQDHRLLGNSTYLDSLRSVLFGSNKIIVGARDVMYENITFSDVSTYPEGIVKFAQHILTTDLSVMSVKTATKGDVTHYFAYPFMVSGDVMSRGIHAFVETTAEVPITSTNRVLLAWWNYDPSYKQPGGSAITVSTAEFLPTQNADTPIHVVGMSVIANRQFGSEFLTSFIVSPNLYSGSDGAETTQKPQKTDEFKNYLDSSPGITDGGQVNLLRDIYGGQNLAAFNNNSKSGKVELRELPTQEFLQFLNENPTYKDLQDRNSTLYEDFMSPKPSGISDNAIKQVETEVISDD